MACDVKLADNLGWARLNNGELLTKAEGAGFDVLLTGDKTIRHEQNMTGRKIALLYMSDNHWPLVKDHVPAIQEAINQAKPGEVRMVSCGAFVRRTFNRPSSP
jgi:hypothetical protein